MTDRFVVVPASYVYLLREGAAGTEVLLQLRQNTGYMDGRWAAAAAGHVERGETAYDAARREALEEVGVDDHGDKISRGIDQAAAAADKKTKGKYSRHIGTGSSKAKEALDKLDDKRDGDVR